MASPIQLVLGVGWWLGGNEWELNAPSTNPTAPLGPGRSAAKNGTGEDGGKRLGKRGPYLERSVRIRLFGVVQRLRRQKLSYSEIIREIERTYSVRLSKSTVSYWSRRIHNPYNGCRTPSIELLKKSPDLSYVIGVVAGDGSTFKRGGRSGEYRVGAEVKDREFVEEFSRCLGRVLGRDPPNLTPVEGGKFKVQVQSKALYLLLQKPINIERIRIFVEYSEDCMRSFLRGFFDSEGCVDKNGVISCSNADTKLLEYVRELLRILGIETRGPRIKTRKGTPIFNQGKTYKTKKDVYEIGVRAKSRLKFYRLVGFTIQRKKQRLENYLKKRGLLNTPPNQPSP